MDKVIAFLNANSTNTGVTIKYAVLSEYFDAVAGAGASWSTFHDDFFPYDDAANRYWTGVITMPVAVGLRSHPAPTNSGPRQGFTPRAVSLRAWCGALLRCCARQSWSTCWLGALVASSRPCGTCAAFKANASTTTPSQVRIAQHYTRPSMRGGAVSRLGLLSRDGARLCPEQLRS